MPKKKKKTAAKTIKKPAAGKRAAPKKRALPSKWAASARGRKPAKKSKGVLTVPKTPVSAIAPEQQIVGATFLGKIKDYYARQGAATLVLEAALSVGETIRVKGFTTDLTQKVDHLEVNHRSVPSAVAGEGVGVKLADRARTGDAVYKI